MIDRPELRRLLAAATPRPWEAFGADVHGADPCIAGPGPDGWVTEHHASNVDVRLIVAAVNALPELLDRIDALELWREKVALALGIADDLRGEGRGVRVETDPDRAAETAGRLHAMAQEHEECPTPCLCHDDRMAEPHSCKSCNGFGIDCTAPTAWVRKSELDAAQAKLAAIRELHTRITHWQCNERGSYESPEQAADDSECDCPRVEGGTTIGHTAECLAALASFDICESCAEIETADSERQDHGGFSGYDMALWPCPTIRTIEGEDVR